MTDINSNDQATETVVPFGQAVEDRDDVNDDYPYELELFDQAADRQIDIDNDHNYDELYLENREASDVNLDNDEDIKRSPIPVSVIHRKEWSDAFANNNGVTADNFDSFRRVALDVKKHSEYMQKLTQRLGLNYPMEIFSNVIEYIGITEDMPKHLSSLFSKVSEVSEATESVWSELSDELAEKEKNRLISYVKNHKFPLQGMNEIQEIYYKGLSNNNVTIDDENEHLAEADVVPISSDLPEWYNIIKEVLPYKRPDNDPLIEPNSQLSSHIKDVKFVDDDATVKVQTINDNYISYRPESRTMQDGGEPGRISSKSDASYDDIDVMVEIADRTGWNTIDLKGGKEDVYPYAWQQLSIRGIKVTGYEPSADEVSEMIKLRADYLLKNKSPDAVSPDEVDQVEVVKEEGLSFNSAPK